MTTTPSEIESELAAARERQTQLIAQIALERARNIFLRVQNARLRLAARVQDEDDDDNDDGC